MDRLPLGDGLLRGGIDGYGHPVPDAPISCIMAARILWTYASAVTSLEEGPLRERCLGMAGLAEQLLVSRFMDTEFGGCYWSLRADGSVLSDKKQYYAIAFAVYAFSAMHAAGSTTALQHAVDLYRDIREHSLDPVGGGYLEASTRDWQPIEDMRLSDKDRNDAKTMNTHLHILEAWSALYRQWPDKTLQEDLRSLIELFLKRIIRPDGHLCLFFTQDWKSTCDSVSYGHDIECSWLLAEAAESLGDAELLERVRKVCARMADAAMQGYRHGLGMSYELDGGVIDYERHWWVQAETIVGCLWQWRSTGQDHWLACAQDAWEFVRENLLAPDGEWYWSILPDGRVNYKDDRAGFWKCPYHNGRMCMEALRIL